MQPRIQEINKQIGNLNVNYEGILNENDEIREEVLRYIYIVSAVLFVVGLKCLSSPKYARTGMFGPLFAARVGQHLQIKAPQETRKYVVTEYYPRWPITDLKWLRPADHEELVLITCTTYNYNDPRIIVVAQPQ